MDKVTGITQKQILRGRVLRLCGEATPIGAGTDVIATILKKEGYYEEGADARKGVIDICTYLEGKGLVRIESVKNEVLNIRRDIIKITPDGVDVLDGVSVTDGITLS